MGFGLYDYKNLAIAQALQHVKFKQLPAKPKTDEQKRRAAEIKRRVRMENAAQAETIRRHRLEAANRKQAGIASIEIQGDEWLDFFPNKKEDRRSAMLRHAKPAWADNDEIQQIYDERDRLNTDKPNEYHVDHIYPILGKTVCGLHVADNLRIITRDENLRKLNKHPDN